MISRKLLIGDEWFYAH